MDVLEAINTRRSVRSYSDRPIPPEVLERLRGALRAAPSACNFQPWRFVFVQNPELRRQLASTANDQFWIAEAPLVVVACGLPQQAYKHMGGYGNSVEIDVAIAVDHLTLAAVAEGLGTCWVGAFDERRLKRLLAIPDAVKIIALTPVGYPTAPDLNAPLDDARRKPPSEIFSTDRYGPVT
ncbi:MAG: nitroreductase family protein [Phycisphaerae bacterium]|nr:nitroreductase family protein [Phycisphaerae bacterium]